MTEKGRKNGRGFISIISMPYLSFRKNKKRADPMIYRLLQVKPKKISYRLQK